MRELFERGYKILKAAPVVLIPVAIVILYNDYSNAFFNWLTGAKPHFTLAGFFVELADFLRALPILVSVLLFALGTLAACAVSIFSTMSFTLAFRGLPNSLTRALRQTRPKSIFFLFLCHMIVTPVALLVLALCYRVLSLANIPLHWKSYVLLTIIAVVFILYYMALATAVVIAIVDDNLSEKFKKFRYFATIQNLSRLTKFYLIRIGAEFLIIGLIGVLLSWLKLASEYFVPIVIAALTVLPFALLRSSGFVLKLDMLRSDAYFRTLFQRYYE